MPTPPRELPHSIAFHIGAHKTASTHLQKTLFKNRFLLSDESIRIFNPGYLRMPGRSLASMFGMSWSDTPPPRRGPLDQLAFLAKGHKRLVFSEENFVGVLSNKLGRVSLPLYGAATERIEELAAAWAPIAPQIYLGVRNPASFMASAYSQALFGSAHIGPRTFRARNDWRRVDWADYVARLRDAKGIGEIYVWRQEDYAQSYRLILRRLLRWKVGGKIEPIEDRIHQGLSAAAVRQTLEWAQSGQTGKLAVIARDQLPINEENAPFRLYAASTLADAENIYAEQMARIEAMDGVTVLHPPAAVTQATQKG